MSNRRSTAKLSAVIGMLALSFAVLAPDAHSNDGYYYVNVCKSAAGGVTSGWEGGSSGANTYSGSSCPSDGSLFAYLDANVSHAANASSAWVSFLAPENTEIKAYELNRFVANHASAHADTSVVYWMARPERRYETSYVVDRCAYFEGCLFLGGYLQESFADGSEYRALHFVASCRGTDGQTCPPAPGAPAAIRVDITDGWSSYTI